MSTTNVPKALWRKSRYSNGQASCVEVGQSAAAVVIRDTKNPDGSALAFTPVGWQAFTRRVRNGMAGR